LCILDTDVLGYHQSEYHEADGYIQYLPDASQSMKTKM